MLPKKPSYDDYFEQKTSTFHGQSLGVTISIQNGNFFQRNGKRNSIHIIQDVIQERSEEGR